MGVRKPFDAIQAEFRGFLRAVAHPETNHPKEVEARNQGIAGEDDPVAGNALHAKARIGCFRGSANIQPVDISVSILSIDVGDLHDHRALEEGIGLTSEIDLAKLFIDAENRDTSGGQAGGTFISASRSDRDILVISKKTA